METLKQCGICKHFRRHYIKRGKNYYIALDMGHCIHPRLKDRECSTPACKHFSEQKQSAEQQ